MLSLLWIVLGIKHYFDRCLFSFSFEDSITLLCGVLSVIIGCMIYINFYDFLYTKSNLYKGSFFWKAIYMIKSILFNYSFPVFDIDLLNILDNKVNDIPLNNKCLGYFYSLIYYIFIGINNLPLLCNNLIKRRLLDIPFILFPSPISVCSYSIFLSYFGNSHLNSFFKFFKALCYSFLVLVMIHEIYVIKVVSFEHYFFIFQTILNVPLYYLLSNFFEIFLINNIVKKTDIIGNYLLVINKHKKGDAGIQGFLGRIFKCDKFGIVADAFLIFNSNNSLINDDNTKEITLDAKHINLIYPIRNSLL